MNDRIDTGDPTKSGNPATSGLLARLALNADRLAQALIVGLLVVAAIYLTRLWSDRWFHNDVWGYLQRTWSFEGVLQPHAGHSVPLNIMATMAVRDIVGFDVAPAFPMLRTFSWLVYISVLMFVSRQRGASLPMVLAAGVLLVVWPLAVWQEGWWLTNPLAHAGALVIGLTLSTVENPGTRQRWLLAAGVAALTLSGSLGVIFSAALVMAVIVSGRGRRWWPVLIVPPLVYVGWRVILLESTQGPGFELGQLSDAVVHLPRLLLAATETTLGLPSALSVVALLAALGLVARAFITTKRIPILDLALLATAYGFVLAVIAFRIDPGFASPLAIRYQYNIFLLFIALVLPYLRAPTWLAWAAVVGAGAVLITSHVPATNQAVSFWERRTAAERELLATELRLIDGGQEYIPTTGVGAQPLTAEALVELASRGLSASIGPPNLDREPTARGWLEIDLRRRGTLPEPHECSESIVYELSKGQRVLATLEQGSIELVTASGPAIVEAPARGTYSITPLFNDDTETVRIEGTGLCTGLSQ